MPCNMLCVYTTLTSASKLQQSVKTVLHRCCCCCCLLQVRPLLCLRVVSWLVPAAAAVLRRLVWCFRALVPPSRTYRI